MSENQSPAEVNSTGYKKPEKTQEEKDKFAAYQRGRRAALKAGTWAPGRRSKGGCITAPESSPVEAPSAS